MPQTYTTRPGDMLDMICYRAYGGRQVGAVEKVLEANSNISLSLNMPVLPPGLEIVLPDMDFTRLVRTEALWD